MTERKPPRRTRERILETSLSLLNRLGEPHVTTADIADEMNISPGNLYYHFRNKDEIIGELAARHAASVAPLLAVPRDRPSNVEDLWLLLHLLFERMGEYRFLYRDLDELTSRNHAVGRRLADLVRHAVASVRAHCAGMANAGTMRASARELDALARNVVLVATYWMSFERLARGPRENAHPADVGRAAYHVMALVAPYLDDGGRALLERLGADYL